MANVSPFAHTAFLWLSRLWTERLLGEGGRIAVSVLWRWDGWASAACENVCAWCDESRFPRVLAFAPIVAPIESPATGDVVSNPTEEFR